ncbi:MAG: family 43 glycosylhydrolase [Lachnospiraceae bacterium]|nr:family 43 glycosylhydrolase [Lachnospiraceae bacterium]
MKNKKLSKGLLAGTLSLCMVFGSVSVAGAEESTEAETAAVTGAAETELAADAEDTAEAEPTDETTQEETEADSSDSVATTTHVSVHDPSIFKSEDGQYYIVGSHIASATSSDLISWTQLSSDYSDDTDAPFYGNLQETFAEPFEWAGYDDGDCVGSYAIWAADAIWNPYYEWEDGDTGAYMLYCCTSSTWRRSCICYLVSKEVDGTYTYGDTLVYSGFTKTGETDGDSTRDTSWDIDYLNLTELIALGSENGGIDEISDNWFNDDGSWNHNYAPNAIDPTIFFDASGEKLYMTYGSWSGGIFLLELDPTTGEAIYPGVDSTDELSGNYVDRYFGVHLAGGNHESGEGPYIQYDEETGYYYLYETYGSLTAEGGYNMRMFRSENVTGPYVDAAGNNAADNGEDNESYGIKLIGNYCFYGQIGTRSAGHNSMLIDDDGSRYLVYHQRFDVTPQLEAHEVRVHQLFLNEDLWPVTAVYEYVGDEPANYEASEVIGSYEFVNHGTATDGSMLDTELLTLYEDGTFDGAATGTWVKTDSGNGYDYVTFTMDDGTIYKGYFFLQHKDSSTETAMTFTAIGTDNSCIWGSMVDMDDPEMVVGMASVSIGQMIPEATCEDIELPSEVLGATVTWTTSDASLVSETGEVTPQEKLVKATLTAEITYGDVSATEEYKVVLQGASSLICGYDFDEEAIEGAFVTAVEGSALDESAELVGDAAIVTDEERGSVLQVTNEEGAKGVNYLSLPSDTLSSVSTTGYSVSMWVNISEDTWEHSALFEADASASYPLTRIGANLIARINANDAYSDVTGSLLTTSGERGVWQHVVYTCDPYGIRVYLNGELVGEESKDLANCFKKAATGISQATDISVGSGYIWDDEDCRNVLFDDVMVYSGVLTLAEVQALYAGE